MRIALALAAFLAASVTASAQGALGAAACRDIQDSLLRLRCFDEALATAPSQSPSSTVAQPVTKTAEPHFARFAAERFSGPIQLPDFRGRDREHAQFRTRILAGAKAGPNFAGHLTMVEIGCGSSCRIVPVVDVRTGRVIDFPMGGEDYYSLSLKYRADSRLVSARWVSDERCKQEDVVWTGSAFQRGRLNDIGTSEVCYQIND